MDRVILCIVSVTLFNWLAVQNHGPARKNTRSLSISSNHRKRYYFAPSWTPTEGWVEVKSSDPREVETGAGNEVVEDMIMSSEERHSEERVQHWYLHVIELGLDPSLNYIQANVPLGAPIVHDTVHRRRGLRDLVPPTVQPIPLGGCILISGRICASERNWQRVEWEMLINGRDRRGIKLQVPVW